MDLDAIIKSSQKAFESITDSSIILTLSKFEQYVDESYQGRIFFELIQNARDAAYQKGIASDILILIENNKVIFANTGKAFDEGGVKAMTRLGLSDKSDRELIGHKGIGFKAIQEFTKEPRIITAFGTLYFDRNKFKKRLDIKFPKSFLKESNVPLFSYPFYDDTKNFDYTERLKGKLYDTIIEFPLNKNKTEEEVANLYKSITEEELILLGSVANINFQYGEYIQNRRFINLGNSVSEVMSNDKVIRYKVFASSQNILLPETVFNKLDENEQEIFQENKVIDIRLVVEIDNQDMPITKDSKLFLFYPLEIHSGFNYIIHSNFSCNPERTSVRDTHLNRFIFENVAGIQAKILLPYLKQQCRPERVVDFIYFERRNDKLNYLYDSYINALKDESFIWLPEQNKFVGVNEVVLCPKIWYDLLKSHTINGLYPLFVDDKLKKFLVDHFMVPVLLKSDIENEIETICEQERSNSLFFTKLYQYCSKGDINLSGKKILLGSSNELYSKADDVFYAVKINLEVPSDISDKLIVLHNSISIETEIVPMAVKMLGIREYRTLDIVEKALELLQIGESNRFLLLSFLKSISDPSEAVRKAIKQKILVPVRQPDSDTTLWISPLNKAVYISNENLLELYPNSYFVEIESCISIDSSRLQWLEFFLKYGVWDKPGIYILDEYITTDNSRVESINSRVSKRAYGYRIIGDRTIDFPETPNHYFFNCIVKRWADYATYIDDVPVDFTVKSTTAVYSDKPQRVIGLTSFTNLLMSKAWIFLSEEQSEPLKPQNVFGLNRLDATMEKHLLKHLNIFIIDYTVSGLIDILKIKHFNAYNINHSVNILNWIHTNFKDREGTVLDNDFKRLYHTVLKYIYNSYNRFDLYSAEQFISKIKTVRFLSKDISKGDLISWQLPMNVYHVDDRLTFEQLPVQAKNLLKYFFTKNDKNEIGKLFAKIGKSLTHEVVRTLKSSNQLRYSKLTSNVPNLQYILLAIEDRIEEHVGDQALTKIKNTIIEIYETLENEISLKSNPDFKDTRLLKFHYDSKSNKVFINRDYESLTDKSLFGDILNHVFSGILGRELERSRLFKDLLYGRTTGTFRDALKDFEYDNERLLDIEANFREHNLTPTEIFWDAVLYAKGINDVGLDHSEHIDISFLACKLNAHEQKIVSWHKSLNYSNLNTESNYDLLQEIILSEGIFFLDLNAKLGEPIDFEYLYKRKYNILKNVNINAIKILLHTYFSALPVNRQRQFNMALDNIEKLEPKGWAVPMLEFDAAKDLIEDLNQLYPEIDFSMERIASTGNAAWKYLQGQIQTRKNRFKNDLRKGKVNMSSFESFISIDSNYSLLYFENYQILIEEYKVLYPEESKRNLLADIGNETNHYSFPVAEMDTKNIVGYNIIEGSKFSDRTFDEALKKIKGGKASSSGSFKSNLVDQNYIKHIGGEGEKLVFLKLSAIYGNDNVKWVSENCIKLGFVPDKEAVGYDIRYIDNNHETHYVEVKSSVRTEPEFHISINEVRAAKKYGAYYHVVWITSLFDSSKREYYDLHNMFMEFSDGEDFFYNSKFYPELTAFKIIFRQESIQLSQDIAPTTE